MIPFNTTLFGGDGIYEFYTVATDEANNVEPSPGSPDAYTTVDTSAPVTQLVLDSEPNSGGWYDDHIDVALWASDGGSGVDSTWYMIGDADWEQYDSGFSIAQEGMFELRYYSVDNAGNNEQVHSMEIGIDVTTPVLKVLEPGIDTVSTVDDLVVSWNCTDAVSGVHHVVVTLDDDVSEYCNSTTTELLLSDLDPGHHNVTVSCYDNAGNWANVTVSYEVRGEDEEPAETENGTSNDWAAWAFFILAVVIFVSALVYVVRSRGQKGG
jgi:hypothetical protein